jgi:prevent-host-death family protein
MAARKTGRRAGSTARRGVSISATEAQNNFGRVLADAASEGVVYITKYDRPTAVVLSIREYDTLTASADAELEELTGEFDALLDRMQASKAANGFDALFELGSDALGAAAVRAARRSAAGAGKRRAGDNRRAKD